jgi:hypothetical protein
LIESRRAIFFSSLIAEASLTNVLAEVGACGLGRSRPSLLHCGEIAVSVVTDLLDQPAFSNNEREAPESALPPNRNGRW